MLRKRNNYYVYILYREDGVTPFYVGKGHRKRINNHEKCAYSEKSHKAHIIREILAKGLSVEKRKIKEGLTNAEACTLEIQLIATFGREPKGILTNLSSGGDSTCGMLGKKHTEITKKKMSQSALGKIISPEQRMAASRFHKGREHPPKERAARIAGLLKYWENNEDARNHLSKKMKEVRAYTSQTARDKLRAANLGKTHSAATKEKMTASRKTWCVSLKMRALLHGMRRVREHRASQVI